MFQILSFEEMNRDIKRITYTYRDLNRRFTRAERPEILVPEPDIVHGNKCYEKYTINSMYKWAREFYSITLNYKIFLKMFPEYNFLYTTKQGRSTKKIYTVYQVKNIVEDLADLIKFKLTRANRV